MVDEEVEEAVDTGVSEELAVDNSDGSGKRILQSLKDTELDIRVVICEQDFKVGDLMGMGPGTILVLDASVQVPAWATVNGKQFAYGKIVQVGECYGFQIEKLK
ncbi:MAG: flagellar motor switch/type III secretory pathway protein FliN [Chlamydiales bacterium]|jgi:flagellar motor switch/type III secretory pathway protein FliN